MKIYPLMALYLLSTLLLVGCHHREKEAVSVKVESDDSVRVYPPADTTNERDTLMPQDFSAEETVRKNTIPILTRRELMRIDNTFGGKQEIRYLSEPFLFRKPRKKVKTINVRSEELVGEWVTNDTDYEIFFADSTGITWDTQDDMDEEFAIHFHWCVTDGCLINEYEFIFGEMKRMEYIVEFDSMNMVRCDLHGNRKQFTRLR